MGTLAAMKPRRRLKKVWVNFISLVEEGANRRTIIWKSAQNLPDKTPLDHIFPISKVDDDKRIVYGIVYAPDEVDTDGDIATADVIKDMAYRFMREKQEDMSGEPGKDTRSIDKQHNTSPDQGYVAETWIVRKNDNLFPETKNLDAWAVGIKIEDEDTWQEIKKGKIKGLSMEGPALVEDLEKQEDKSVETQKIIDAMPEIIKKAFVTFGWSGQVGEEKVATPPSIKDDLMSLLKDVKTPEQAKAVIETIGKFNEQLTADVTDLLKGVTTASPASPALDTKTAGDPLKGPVGNEPALDAIAKSVSDTVSEGLKPFTDAMTGVIARLEVLEKTGVGRQTGLPTEGDPADNGKTTVSFTGVEVPD